MIDDTPEGSSITRKGLQKNVNQTKASLRFTRTMLFAGLIIGPAMAFLILLLIKFYFFPDTRQFWHFVFIPIWLYMLFYLGLAVVSFTIAIAAAFFDTKFFFSASERAHTAGGVIVGTFICATFPFLLSTPLMMYLNLAVLPFKTAPSFGESTFALPWIATMAPLICLLMLFGMIAWVATAYLCFYGQCLKYGYRVLLYVSGIWALVAFGILFAVYLDFPSTLRLEFTFFPLYLMEVLMILVNIISFVVLCKSGSYFGLVKRILGTIVFVLLIVAQLVFTVKNRVPGIAALLAPLVVYAAKVKLTALHQCYQDWNPEQRKKEHDEYRRNSIHRFETDFDDDDEYY